METTTFGRGDNTMFKLWKVKPWTAIPVAAAAAVLAGVVAAPATASAATLWVSNAAPSAPYDSCLHTGYQSIQAAVNHATPGSTINICGGTYKEQLEIETEVSLVGKGNPTVALTATPGASNTQCDRAINTAIGGSDQDLVSICKSKVSITKMTFEAKWPAGTCDDTLYGIMVAGGGTLEASKVKVDGAGAFPINGCQGGVGIEVGFGYNIDEPGHATLEKVTLENYQKNGITVDGEGSTASITHTTATGAGPADQGQNGIQVSRGAVADISNTTISDNECTAPSCGQSSPENWAEDAAGVLFYEPGTASTVSSSKLSDNDIGVEYVSGEPPAASEVTLSGDTVTGGYLSVQLNQGKATLENDKLKGGLVGIDASSYFYGNDSYGPKATATGDKIEGSRAAVQVESSLSGLAGSLALSSDHVKGYINNYDPQFVITG